MDTIVFDARTMSVSPEARIAGLTVVARHLRTAARAKLSRVVFVTDDPDAIARALARRPQPLHPRVDVMATPPEGAPVVSASALWSTEALVRAAAGKDFVPELLLLSDDDLPRAEALLFERIRKSVEADGVVAYYVQRPLSRLITRAVIDTHLGPNQVTLVAMALGLAAAILAATGEYGWTVLAGALYWLGGAVDCVDGEIARLRMEGSKLGEWLDTLADDVSTFGLLLGLGLGLAKHGPLWPALCFVATVLGALATARLYADLHRAGRTIDTAQYPWFFGSPSGQSAPRSGFGKLVHGFTYLFRRDAFATIILALFVLDLPRVAAALLAGGALLIAGLLAVHLAVTRARST